MTERMDLHLHSTWSDGDSDASSAVEFAIGQGSGTVGLCDHWGAERYGTRSIGDLRGYLEELAALKRQFAGRVRLLAGVELPARRALLPISPEDREALVQLDYMLLEDLEYLGDRDSIQAAVRALQDLPCAKGLAHCDLFRLAGGLGLDDDGLAEWLARAGLFWEINAGIQHAWFDDVIDYERVKPVRLAALFDALDRHGVRAAAGSDAHTREGYPAGRLTAVNELIAKHLLAVKL